MASHVLTTKKRGGGTVETPARPSPEKKARDSSAIPRVAERALERGSLLGSGELNDVYRARWNFSAVALKVVRAQPRRAAKSASAPDAVAATAAEPPSASLRRQLRARALQCMVHEARSLRALEDHGATCVPRCLATLRSGRGLVTDLAPGASLETLWVRAPGVEDDSFQVLRAPLPIESVLQLLRQVLTALQTAHAMVPALVHRDVHPGNVVWCADTARATLIDWAEARREDAADGAVHSRWSVGLHEYRAPEAGRHMSRACDVWALAVVARELFLGTRPAPQSGVSLQALLSPPPAAPFAAASAALNADVGAVSTSGHRRELGRLLDQCTDRERSASTRPTAVALLDALRSC